MTNYILAVLSLVFSVPVFSQHVNHPKPYHKVVKRVERDLHRLEKSQRKFQKSENEAAENPWKNAANGIGLQPEFSTCIRILETRVDFYDESRFGKAHSGSLIV